MKSLFYVWILFCFACQLTFAQESKIISGTAEYLMHADEHPEELKELVRTKAKLLAIESAFGAVIYQGNSTWIVNQTSGNDAQTKTEFRTVADSYVKGEWMETISESFEEVVRKVKRKGKPVTERWLICKIRGKAREIKTLPAQFLVETLHCPNLRCSSTDFKDGDRLFVYFRSAVPGYLMVFLDDLTDANLLLPYSKMPADFQGMAFPVSADSAYILFSNRPEHNYFQDRFFQEDELMLTAESPKTQNRMYVLFSEKPFRKPLTEPARMLPSRFGVPARISSDAFQTWLQEQRALLPEIQLQVIDLTIQR